MATEIVWRRKTEHLDCIVKEEDVWADPLALGDTVADAINGGGGACVHVHAEVRSMHGLAIFGRAGPLQVVQPMESDESGIRPDYVVVDHAARRAALRAAITDARQTLQDIGGIPGIRLREPSSS